LPQEVANSIQRYPVLRYLVFMETTTQLNDDFRLWLQSELMNRCKRNPRYTLRNFATLLEMDSSTVSQLISGKRRASVKVITKICEKLQISPILAEKFLSATKSGKGQTIALKNETSYQLVNEDAIAILSNWYYFAILEIINADNFQHSYSWIAKRLSMNTAEIKIAVERLVRLNLLTIEEGKIKRTDKFLSTYAPGHTSAAQKEFQKQILKMALAAIDDVPIVESALAPN
jgi:uncharacterized protein (TIGR02147 family)